MSESSRSLLVVSAHAGDFVWRAGGAIALASSRGERAVIACLTYGERGESASSWREGKSLEEIKSLRRREAEAAAGVLGAEIVFLDAGDYPLVPTQDVVDRLVAVYRDVQPSTVLTHTRKDPYNFDHERAAELALEARILSQAVGYPADGDPGGAPPVFSFEPHQPEMCDFVPDVLLDITPVYETKEKAMLQMAAQEHLWNYYRELARRRGVQLERNSGPNIGIQNGTQAEAFARVYPQTTKTLD